MFMRRCGDGFPPRDGFPSLYMCVCVCVCSFLYVSVSNIPLLPLYLVQSLLFLAQWCERPRRKDVEDTPPLALTVYHVGCEAYITKQSAGDSAVPRIIMGADAGWAGGV